MSNNMELTEYITMKSNKGVLQKYFLKKEWACFIATESCPWCYCYSVTKSDSTTPWTVVCHTPLSSTVSWSLLKFMCPESVMPSNHLILCHLLLLLSSIFPNIRVFSNKLALHRGFPGGANGKGPTCQCRRHERHGFNPWVGEIPWRRA